MDKKNILNIKNVFILLVLTTLLFFITYSIGFIPADVYALGMTFLITFDIVAFALILLKPMDNPILKSLIGILVFIFFLTFFANIFGVIGFCCG